MQLKLALWLVCVTGGHTCFMSLKSKSFVLQILVTPSGFKTKVS